MSDILVPLVGAAMCGFAGGLMCGYAQKLWKRFRTRHFRFRILG